MLRKSEEFNVTGVGAQDTEGRKLRLVSQRFEGLPPLPRVSGCLLLDSGPLLLVAAKVTWGPH